MSPYFITQYIIFVVFAVAMFALGFVLKSYLKRYDFGFLIIIVWAAVLNLFLFLDYFKINRDKVMLGLAVLALGFVVFSLRNKQSRQIQKQNFRPRAFVALVIVWLAGLFILNLPLLTVFPAGTLITGNQISDDSIVHANLVRGFEFTDGSRYLYSRADDSTSPRAFHSFTYFLNLNSREAYEVLLPSILFGYSLIVVAIYSIVNGELRRSRWNYLLMLAPVTPFLVVDTAYTMFLNQTVVIPLLVATVYFVLRLKPKELQVWDWVVFALLVMALFNTYSILPVAVVAFTVFLKILNFLFEERKNLRNFSWVEFSSEMKAVKGQSILILISSLVLLAILSIPGFISTKNLLAFERQTQGLTASVGNLPDGFLDPFHLTGLWSPFSPYRGYLDEDLAWFGFVLLCYFAIQIAVILKGRPSTRLLLTNIALFVPVVGGMFILNNYYIHFKFVTFFLPVFVTTFFICIYKWVDLAHVSNNWLAKFSIRKLRVVAVVVSVSVMAFAIFYPLDNYKDYVPSIQGFRFDEMKYLADNYLTDSRTIILSEENWFQYFSYEADDFTPMTLYYVKSFPGGDLDKVIVDEAYDNSVEEYLTKYQTDLYAQMNKVPKGCVTKPLKGIERYTLYDLTCIK